MSVPPGVDPSGKSWLPALIAGGSQVLGSILAFKLNKRETDTAHQRERRDLEKAGLNPLLTAQGRGAGSADASQVASGVERGVSSALAVQMAKAQIDAIKAQAQQSTDSAFLARTQAFDLQTQANSGRYDLIGAQRDLANLSVQEKRAMLPILIARAKAEVEETLAGAERARVLASLDKLRVAGFKNIEALEKDLGEAGPAGRFILEILRSLR